MSEASDSARLWTERVVDATRIEGRRGSGAGSGEVTPIGVRGQRTRQALLSAAHRLFGVQGYQATTVAQISEAAGVSLGTFYQYFADRQAIVAELVGQAVARVMGPAEGMEDRLWRVRDGRPGLERMISAYVRLVAEDVHFWRAWEEVSHTDERIARVRRDLGRVLTESVERELTRGVRSGLVRSDVVPALTARALTGMVDRFVYTTYFFDPPDPLPTPDESARLLTDLWVGALGLDSGEPPTAGGSSGQ